MSVVATGMGGREGVQLGGAADRFARVALSVPDGRTSAPEAQQAPAMLAGLSEAELAARHLNLALRAGGSDSARGWMAVMQQMSRTTRAVQDAHSARHELVAATRTLGSVPAALEQTTGRLERVAHLEELPAEVRAAAREASDRAARLDQQLRRGPTAGRGQLAARPSKAAESTRNRDNDRGM